MKRLSNDTLQRLYAFLRECEDFVFLDTSRPDRENTVSLLFCEPLARLQLRGGEDVDAYLALMERYQAEGYCLAGWLAYEFGYLLEPSLAKRLPANGGRQALLADFGVFRNYYHFDHLTGHTDLPLAGKLDLDTEEYGVEGLRPSMDEAEYIEALERVLGYIEAGDTYQVNYTLKLLFDFHGSAERFYDDLRRNQSVGYGACMRRGDRRVLSFSPELFFRKDQSCVTVRPMKGTVKRGRTLEEDDGYRRFLRTDNKNRSENVMIVDLLRNDLGRLMHCASNGEVRVDSLFDVETYETLLQMTSTITGCSDEKGLQSVSLGELLRAMFPCGSVTGAPKIRTMEIIAELERQPRGVYTGAIGYLLPGGEAVFNVPIRTVVLDGNQGEMGIGSGIVHDSEPEREWQECLLKGRFLTAPQEPFQLIETMLWRPGSGIWLEEEHLQRLQASAEFFLFACDIEEMQKDLRRQLKPGWETHRRLRLLLAKDGSWRLDVQACPPPIAGDLAEALATSGELPEVTFCDTPIDSSLAWYFHKTTNRALYAREYERAGELGLADVLFTNEHGRVTESCIANVIALVDGEYVTPPVADGLLAGVMRRHLLDSDPLQVVERSLTPAELLEAEALFLCNSVRGVTRVRLVGGG